MRSIGSDRIGSAVIRNCIELLSMDFDSLNTIEQLRRPNFLPSVRILSNFLLSRIEFLISVGQNAQIPLMGV